MIKETIRILLLAFDETKRKELLQRIPELLDQAALILDFDDLPSFERGAMTQDYHLCIISIANRPEGDWPSLLREWMGCRSLIFIGESEDARPLISLRAIDFFIHEEDRDNDLAKSVSLAYEFQRIRRLMSAEDNVFLKILLNGSDAICILNEEGVILYVSDASERTLGLKPETFVGKAFLDCIHEGDRTLALERFRYEIAHPGETPVTICRIRHQSGEWRYIEIWGLGVSDPEMRGVFLACRDVSARKSAERRLAESMTMLQATLDATTDGIAGIDKNGSLTAFNSRFLEMWRIPPEQARARGIDAINDSARQLLCDSERFIERQNELFSHPEMERSEVIEFKDGRVYEHISKPHWIGDEYVGRINAYKDLTSRLKVEADLCQVITRARCILWVADAERTGDDLVWRLHVQEVDAAQQVIPLDIPPGETYTRVWTAHYHPEDKKRLKRTSREAFISGKSSYQHDFRCYDKYGNERWLFEDVHIEPIVENRWRATGVCTDVTERKRAEEAVRQTQKLESLGVLASGIAHDFNNLLTGILGQTTLALNQMEERSSLRPYLERTEIAAERAADLIRQLLAYTGKAKSERRPIDLNRLIRENANLLGASLDKSISLAVSLSDDLPLIEGDRGQIQQVVMNLVINAAESMSQTGGTVSIRTRQERRRDGDAPIPLVSSAHLNPGDFAVIEVADTGIGIDSKILERIFDPFFTTKKAGKGLGLSATQGIIQAHRGGLSVKSEPGRGSVFIAYFPVDATLVEPIDAVRKRSKVMRGRVLVIDHEELVRDVAREILESAGLTTLVVATGREGVDLFQAHRGEISAALLDMQLPLMSGWETMRELRSIDPSVRLILSSSQEESVSSRELDGMETDGLFFLQKPYSYERLLEKIEESIRSTDDL